MKESKGIMITEDQVVDATSTYLEEKGWQILQKLNSTQKGYDIILLKNKQKLYIEAKGGTSNNPNSNRFGKPFDDSQAKDHIGKAIWKSGEALTNFPNCQIAIALPLEYYHFKHIKKIQALLKVSKIKIFWVDENLVVSEEDFD